MNNIHQSGTLIKHIASSLPQTHPRNQMTRTHSQHHSPQQPTSQACPLLLANGTLDGLDMCVTRKHLIRWTTGTRPTGRPVLCFKDACKQDLKACDISPGNWEQTANDSLSWQQAVRIGLRRTQEKRHMTWQTGKSGTGTSASATNLISNLVWQRLPFKD
jgi:hypothetical protein